MDKVDKVVGHGVKMDKVDKVDKVDLRKTDNPSLKNNNKTNRYHREKRKKLIISRKSSPLWIKYFSIK